MQFVRFFRAQLAGQAGWLSRPLASWPAAQKDPFFIKKGGKHCTRMPNVLIPEVPPAAAGRWDFFQLESFFQLKLKKRFHMPQAAQKAKCWIPTYGGPEARDVNTRSDV